MLSKSNMKFSIDYNGKKEDRLLTYDTNEYGFNIEPKVSKINFGLILNTLDLTVIDDDRRIIEVLGFCGLNPSMISNHDVPLYKEGTLKVIDNLDPGFSYRIHNKEQPIYVNIKTGWLCIGDPQKEGNGVEFINNCVAVINNEQGFISLWLKPKSLPPL